MRRDVLFLGVVILCVIAIYSRSIGFDLINDDQAYIKNGYVFNSGKPLLAVFQYGFEGGNFGSRSLTFFYRPVTMLTFMVEKKLWNLDGRMLRVVNITIFLLILVSLFALLRRQGEVPYFPWIALSLFAFSPFAVDNVVWIVSRHDLLMLLWALLALLFLDYWMQSGRRIELVASSACFALGVFSKETFLFFFPLIVIYEWIKRRRITAGYHLVNLLAVAVFFLVKHVVLGFSNLKVVSAGGVLANIHLALSITGYYFRALAFPWGLSRFEFRETIDNNSYLLVGILFVALIALLLFLSRKDRGWLFPALLLATFFVPFVMLGFTNYWPYSISIRYMWVPLIGAAWLLARLIARLKIFRIPAVACLLLLYMPASVISMNAYRTEIDYWQDAARSHPANSAVLYFLAHSYIEKQEVLPGYASLRQTLKLPADTFTGAKICTLFARLELMRRRYPEVEQWLSRLPAGAPEQARNEEIVIRAKMTVARDDPDAAERTLLSLLQAGGQKPECFEQLYALYLSHARWDQAAELEGRIRKSYPEFRGANIRALRQRFDSMNADQKIAFFTRYGNYRAAIELLEVKPEKAAGDYCTMLLLYRAIGKPDDARRVADQLIRSVPPNDTRILNTLGALYLRSLYSPEEALVYFRKSLQIRPDPAVRKTIEDIEAYERAVR